MTDNEIGTVIVGLGALFLGFLANQLLWNWAVVPLFHLPPVTYWQMAALTLLGRNMFSRYNVRAEVKK